MKNRFLDMHGEGEIGFFGIGKSSLALISLLAESDAEIILRSDEKIDTARLPEGIRIKAIHQGQDAMADITERRLFFSPSVRRDRPELSDAEGRGCKFSSDFEFFLEANQKPIYLITGSDGKSTTTTLVSRILGECYPAIGNIGEAMTPHLEDGAKGYVVEASSFMLEYARPRSRRAAITSLTENHLNWHKTFEGYKRAKLRGIEGVGEAVISMDSPYLTGEDFPGGVFAATGSEMSMEDMRMQIRAEAYYDFCHGYLRENGRRLIHKSELRRGEVYNIRNYLTALAMTRGLRDRDEAIEVIRGFGGLAHRGEIVGCAAGVTYINSSIDTTPARTMATLSGMPRGIIILLGGRDKGLDLAPLVKLIEARGDRVIAFGEAAGRIRDAVGNRTFTARTMAEAVLAAMETARRGDRVLLSPAAASYDEFSSFEERGEAFKKMVLQDL